MRLTLDPGGNVAALVRGAVGASRVVVISPALDALAMAQAKASIGPLAVELAPSTRVNAVAPGEGADPGDVDAAVAFLMQAHSTTGQVIEILSR